MIGSEAAQAFLRCIYWDGTEASLSLADALKAALRARYKETKSGKALVGTSANGNSVSFFVPAGLSPLAIVETVNYLYNLYTITKTAAPGDTDAQILDTMLKELGPANEFTTDYSAFRYDEAEVLNG